VEYAGAMYHVMARGDRREAIVRDDEDRKTFIRTLGEAAKKTGMRIHAYALISNHYHLLLETPKANLSEGMGWLQNAYTHRMNVKHRLSIAVEPGICFWALLDYVHLNPVRAGIARFEGLRFYSNASRKHEGGRCGGC